MENPENVKSPDQQWNQNCEIKTVIFPVSLKFVGSAHFIY
jgi:hypothetical protein